MKQLSFFIQKLPWQRLIKFAITGGSAFVIDFSMYYILTRFGHLHFITSRILSIGAALYWNFTLNRRWTFRAQTGRVTQQAPRFLLVMAATSVLNLGLMRIGVSTLHFHDLTVMVFVSLFIMGINFILHQFWSYRSRV
jgi:putative flippase GtrA